MRRLRRSVVWRSLRLVFLAAPGLASVLIVASLGMAILNPWIAYTAMRLTEGIVAKSTPVAVRWVVYELLLVCATTILGRLRMDARTLLRGRVELEARLEVVKRVGELELSELEDAGTRDKIEAARLAARVRPLELVNELLTILQSVVGLLIYAFMLAVFNGWALLFLLAAVPGAAAELWSSRAAYREQLRSVRDRRRLGYLDDLLFSESLAAENNFLEIGPALLIRVGALGRRLFSQERAEWRRSVVLVISCQILPPLILNGCYLLMALATVRGAMTLGELMLFSMSLNSAQRLSQRLLESARTTMDSWHHAEALFAFLDTARSTGSASPAAPTGSPSASAGLSLENIGFRYPGAETWAIRNLNVDIRPGEFVAIIGGNGCGKTTLLKLITGQYQPTEGRIRLDGITLAEQNDRKGRFALVFQDFARYGLTVGENVALGRLAGCTEQGPVLEALRMSGAEEMVARLPAGEHTELMPELEGGVGLSGGQWQKIALARGLVREQAEFLVFDEPTSALDEKAENQLFEHLRQSGKTVILITHRLSCLRSTDKVVVLERGRQLAAESLTPTSGVALHRFRRLMADT